MRLSFASRLLDGFLAGVGIAKGDVLGQGAGEEEHVLLDGRDLRTQRFQAPVAHVQAINQHPPAVHVEYAVDELSEGGFAGAGLPHDGDRLAWLGGEADVFQHRIPIVAKADVVEDHLSPNRSGDASRVLVQLRLRVDQFQYPPGAGNPQLDQIEREEGDKGGKAERAQQPHEGDHLAQADGTPPPEQQGVQKAAGPGQAEHQHRQVAGLDLPLLHEIIAEQAGILGELAPLVPLLDVGFDDLDPGDSFCQPRVHRPKLLASGSADRAESPIVINQGDGQQDEEDEGDEQQFKPEPADEDDGDDDGHGRIRDQHHAGAEHQVEHAHVVGGAGHDVADPLPAVEGLALAQQADVQLVAGIPFHPLGCELNAEVPHQSRQALPDGRSQHARRQSQQRGRLPAGGGDQIERPADEDLNEAVKPVVQHGRQEHRQREEWVAQDVGDDPAHRPGAIVVVFVF